MRRYRLAYACVSLMALAGCSGGGGQPEGGVAGGDGGGGDGRIDGSPDASSGGRGGGGGGAGGIAGSGGAGGSSQAGAGGTADAGGAAGGGDAGGAGGVAGAGNAGGAGGAAGSGDAGGGGGGAGRGGAGGSGGAGAGGAAGAGGNAGTGTINGPLAVSAPFYLHQPMPAGAAAGEYFYPSMACNAAGCLIAYGQAIGFRQHVVATRVSPTGAVLGKLTLFKTDDVRVGIARVAVTARASDFLIHAKQSGPQSASGLIHRFWLVDTAGAVRVESTAVFGTGAQPDDVRIFGGGANYLVAYGGTIGAVSKLLLGSALTPIAPGADLGVAGQPSCGIAGPGQYLVAGNGFFVRVSDTTGAALGSAQSFWRYGNPTSGPIGFFANGTFFLLGTRPSPTFSYDIWGVRVDATTGALLDPDDDFNQRSGGILLCENCYPGVQTADPVAGAGFVTVHHDTAGVSAFRFSLSPFARIGPVAGADFSFGTHRPTRLVPVGAGFVALDGGIVKSFTVAPDPFTVGFGSQAIAIPRTPDVSEVSVAYAGSRFLVAAKGMTPTFLVDERGTLAPVANVALGGQVAANGTDFLLTQQAGGQVAARAITPSGAVAAPHMRAISGDNYAREFRLTSNGRTYLMTALGPADVAGSGTVSAIRIAADGTFVDQGQGVVTATAYTVLADTRPPPEMRTFGIFAWSRGAGDGGSVQWMRLRSETGMVVSPASALLDFTGDPNFATDGEFFMAAHRSFLGGVYQMATQILLPGSGGRGYGPYPQPQVPGNASVRGAWHDGRSYLVGYMYQDVPAGDPHARFTIGRYSYATQPLDLDRPEGRDVIPDKFHPGMQVAPVLASDGRGKSLIAYLYADPLYGGVTLKGVIVRNEGYRFGVVATPTCTSGDTFDFMGARLTEGGGAGTDPWSCDPRIGADFRPGDSETLILVHRNYLGDFNGPSSSNHQETLALTLIGPVPTTFPASYSLASGGTATLTYVGSGGRTSCQAGAGTVTITAYGAVGGRIQGSYAGMTWAGTDCPAATSGAFSVTREPDI